MEEKYSKEEEQEAAKSLLFQTKSVSNSPFDLTKLNGRQTFCEEEKLKRAVLIDKLFNEGKRLQRNNLTLIFLPAALDTFYPVQAVFTVPKKNFKNAVDRNLLKRRMREAYRKSKFLLYEKLAQEKKQFAIGFIYKGKEITDYNSVENSLNDLLEKLKNQL